MKRLFSIVLLMALVLGLQAQSVQTWFDGDAYYTSRLTDDDILFF